MHYIGARVIGTLTLVAIVSGLAVRFNPLFSGKPVGGTFFNLILLGYGIPAMLAATLALMTRSSRPAIYSTIAASFALGLSITYLGLEIRTFFHGPRTLYFIAWILNFVGHGNSPNPLIPYHGLLS